MTHDLGVESGHLYGLIGEHIFVLDESDDLFPCLRVHGFAYPYCPTGLFTDDYFIFFCRLRTFILLGVFCYVNPEATWGLVPFLLSLFRVLLDVDLILQNVDVEFSCGSCLSQWMMSWWEVVGGSMDLYIFDVQIYFPSVLAEPGFVAMVTEPIRPTPDLLLLWLVLAVSFSFFLLASVVWVATYVCCLDEPLSFHHGLREGFYFDFCQGPSKLTWLKSGH